MTSIEFLRHISRKDKDLGIILRYNSEKHYRWEKRIFGNYTPQNWLLPVFKSEYSRENIKNFLYLLCDSFEVKRPNIKFCQRKKGPSAISLFMENEIIFRKESAVHPFVVIHEFVHLYGWEKFKYAFTHDVKWAKDLERKLVWTTRKYWENLK